MHRQKDPSYKTTFPFVRQPLTVSAPSFPAFSPPRTGAVGDSPSDTASTDSIQSKTEAFLRQFETPQAPISFNAFPMETPMKTPAAPTGPTNRFISPPQPTAYPAKPLSASD